MLGHSPVAFLPVSDAEEGASNSPHPASANFPIKHGATTPNPIRDDDRISAVPDHDNNMSLEETI